MRFSTVAPWSTRLTRVVAIAGEGRDLEVLRLLVDGLRPARGSTAQAHVEALTEALRAAPQDTGRVLAGVVRRVIDRSRLLGAMTEAGIESESFASGLVSRIGRKLLPPVPEPDDLRVVVRGLFGQPGDEDWVASVDDRSWRALFAELDVSAATRGPVGDELSLAIRILSRHLASLGLDPEIERPQPGNVNGDSPFLRIGVEADAFLHGFENDVADDDQVLLDEVLATLAMCRKAIERLRSEKHMHGTSVRLTGLSFRILTLADRLEILLHLAEPVGRDYQTSVAQLLKALVRAERERDHIRPHVRASADLLAFQVVEHAARKGKGYITTGRSDYYAFLRSSMGGGLLVGLFALVKVVMGDWEVPLAVEATLYGINYSLCFVLIYLTGATLATKQPAMTANTVARSLGDAGHDLSGLEHLVVRVWRSQFVSFLGNLVVALPVGLAVAWGLGEMSGSAVASADKAMKMLTDLHPWRSGSLPWAAVAGVLLFGAGLLSGWIDNLLVYRRIRERIAAHPLLHRSIGARLAARLADGIDASAGALAGNVLLGFGLGSMGTIGEILGLPLDIRHIAFASAHFGAALQVLDFAVPVELVVQVAIGVAGIGLVNFLVSFGLSLFVAMESRGVTFAESRQLVARLGRRLWTTPLDWFFPPRTPRA